MELEREIERMRRKMAELLLRRFEADPDRDAADGIEAVLQLLRCGERERAQEALLRIGHRLSPAAERLQGPGGSPARRAPEGQGALRRGIGLYLGGDMPSARAVLVEAQLVLEAQSDGARAAAAAYYLGRTLLALGDLDGASATTQQALMLAQAARLASLSARAEVLRAQVLLARFQPAAAREKAQLVLQKPALLPHVRVAACYILARSYALHGDMQAAAGALAQASAVTAAADAASGDWEYDLEFAELGFLSGPSPERPLEEMLRRAEKARRYYAARGHRYAEARATLALSAALLLRGRPPDLLQADPALHRALDLCSRHAYGLLHLRGVLLEAALYGRRQDRRRAEAVLEKGLFSAGAAEDSLELRLLRAACKGHDSDADPAAPGICAILQRLGLRSARLYELIDRTGRREGDEQERQRALGVHDLIIELERGVIARGGGGASVSGRPLMAALMAAFLNRPEKGVSAEELFYEVWAGKEYNPLRHRNTIYVAIARLRQALRDLFPGREVLETAGSGWRLSPDVDICAIRAKKD